MNRRLFKYFLTVPDGYKAKDFEGLLRSVKAKTKPKKSGGSLLMPMTHQEVDFNRGRRKFRADVIGLDGNIFISITEA